MLVPEIALTPVIASLFRQTFAGQVAILHSGLSDGERHDEWQRIRRGEVHVVVGTRSAVFAPLARIGLIVVDEEHDGSYKQEESPRYHGRDVAIVRGQRERALVVLASATPSMESYHNALAGRYERVVLERRVRDRAAAFGHRGGHARRVRAGRPGRRAEPRPGRCRSAFASRAREQALVLLNRRGFATAVFCRQCAATLDCPNCSVSLVVHGEGAIRRARCHYCNYAMRVPIACPHCAGPYLEQAGFGTERVEAEVRRALAGRARRPPGSRCDSSKGRADGASVAVPRRRYRRARRHPDDCQGSRFPARHAGRRGVGRRRSRHGGLSRVREDVSAADAGRRPRGPRRAAGRRRHPDDLPGSLQHPAGVQAGLRLVL